MRVTGVRRHHFVEFDYALGDDDLAVEMVLPYPEFVEFCATHDAEMLPGPEEAALAHLALTEQERPTSNERGETTG